MIFLLACVMGISCAVLAKRNVKLRKEEEQFSFIRERMEVKDETEKVSAEFAEIMKKYPDCIGYIEIKDTDVSYPVMQNQDNEYYLHRDMDGRYSNSGCIYMDSNHAINEKGLHVIYGHYMKNGTMFRDVSKFMDSQYMREHQEITIQTAGRKMSLKPVYCYTGRADGSYRSKITAPDQITEFIESHTGCGINTDDLYVLITCSYGKEDERTYLYCIP